MPASRYAFPHCNIVDLLWLVRSRFFCRWIIFSWTSSPIWWIPWTCNYLIVFFSSKYYCFLQFGKCSKIITLLNPLFNMDHSQPDVAPDLLYTKTLSLQ